MSSMTLRFLSKLSVWLVLEVSLTLLSLDNLADYSEFLNHPQFMS